MATITEDYVSFEIAKLLKEKEFDEICYLGYNKNGVYVPTSNRTNSQIIQPDFCFICCPTLQMAMKWLREKYNIYISIQPDFPSDKDYKVFWCWSASILYENCISTKGHQCYIETYEEATEAAIKYCLENLI